MRAGCEAIRIERCPCTNTRDGLEEVLLIAQRTKTWGAFILYSIGAVALEKRVGICTKTLQRRSPFDL